MLKLEITGDTHPKTVKLVTDDANAELAEITSDLDHDWGVEKGDSFRDWFDSAAPEDFATGVVIPPEHVGEWGDVLEGLDSGAGMDAFEQINDLRRQLAEGAATE